MTRTCCGVSMALALLCALLAVPAPVARAQGANDLSIVKDDEVPSNAELAVRLSEETPLQDVERVVISRDDEFADALASGVLQGRSPLMLVPRGGPVSARVLAEITRLGARRAVILGGVGAVSQAVADQLAQAGIAVERRSGASRIETAVEIARAEAASADTAIVARAFGDPNNPTQAFADALAAGGLAAEMGWPILLTQTGALSSATRDYLASSAIRDVKIVGGTAAVSEAVAAEIDGLVDGGVERIAGASRDETAAEVAKERGAESAADVARVVLVDGTAPDGWAGGFAAAAHSALFDAPIVLADGPRLLPETEAFLAGAGGLAQADDTAVTCVAHPLACNEGRRALGLVDFPLLAVEPRRGVRLQPGQTVTLSLSPVAQGAGVAVRATGTCLDAPVEGTTDGAGRLAVTVLAQPPEGFADCQITVGYTGPAGEQVLVSVPYTFGTVTLREPDEVVVGADVLVFGSTVPTTPVFVTDDGGCTTPEGAMTGRTAWAMQGRIPLPDSFATETVNVGSAFVRTQPDATCTLTVDPPAGATQVYWGLYSFSDEGLREPLMLGPGTTASFSFDDIDPTLTDLTVRWLVRVDVEDPGLPATTPPGQPGIVNNVFGLEVSCDGAPVAPGITAVTPGAACTATAGAAAEIEVLLLQPGQPIRSGPSLDFTALDDPRWTTLRPRALS